MSTLSLLVVLVLSMQRAPTPKEQSVQKADPKTKTFLEYRNTGEGITFKMEDGRIELTVPAEKGSKGHEESTTYKTASLDEFKRLYPDIAKKYNVEQYLPKANKPDAIDTWWKEWANRLGGDEERRFRSYLRDLPKNGPDASSNPDRWFDEEHRTLRDLERRLHEDGMPAPAGPAKTRTALFGILAAPVPEPLRAQLGLSARAGLLVEDVERGSIAETAGVKKYDVLLKLSAQTVEDLGRFKEWMTTALQSKEFTLDAIRGGGPLKLTVHPVHS